MIIAKCENCGAALRVVEGTTTIECEYCRVTILASPTAGGAPTLRIEPLPNVDGVDAKTVGEAWVTTIAAVASLGTAIGLAASGGAVGSAVVMAMLSALLLLIAVVWHRDVAMKRRRAEERRWLRDHGLAGRATVQKIRAGQTHHATLGLTVEVQGRESSYLEHETRVPALLVPQLVQGLRIPVVVHPSDERQIEIQWHLV